MDAFDISASAMTSQRLRMDVIASNLANINTTRQADGSVGPYRRRTVVFAPLLENSMQGSNNSFSMKPPGVDGDGPRQVVMENGVPVLKATINNNQTDPGMGVKVVSVSEDYSTPLKMVYDPSNPDANPQGYVSYPNINPVTEMIDMISATRAYEANVSSIQADKTMDKASLEI